MRAADVRAALAKKFAAPEYALFYEVGEGTGARTGRWADAVAMGLWPSRGLELQGFEIKVSRSDWLVELRNPAKAEAVAQYMHRWWIVTPPAIVKPDELPEGWGLYEVKGSGVCCVKQAPRLHAVPIAMPFLAALLRRADEHAKRSVRQAVDDAMRAERGATAERIRSEVDRQLSSMRSRLETAEKVVADIREACGVAAETSIGRWFEHQDFARACGVVHKLGIAKTYGGLGDIAARLRPMADAVETLLAAIPAEEMAG